MSRRRRTIEILTAAQLAPQELAIERERTRRQQGLVTGALQALSMLPTAGASIAGTVAGIEADKKAATEKALAAEEARKRQAALDALNEENTRSQITAREAEAVRAGAAETRAAAGETRAQAAADAMSKKSALEEAAAAREAAMEALRARARAGVALPTLIGAASADDRLGDLDDDAVAGVMKEEQAKAREQSAKAAKLEEQAKPKPAVPPKRSPSGGGAPGGGGSRPPKEPPAAKPSAQAEARKAKATGLASDLTMLEGTVKDLEQSDGPNPGPVLGRVRSAVSGFIDDPKQTAYEAAAAAVNSQIFGLLRTDAPSESEAKVIQALQFYPTDRPKRIRAKVATIRQILKARGADEEAPLDVLAARVSGAPATTPDPAAVAEADALFAD